MIEVTFKNVEITIIAETPKIAYSKLCNALNVATPDVEWATDTFVVFDPVTRETTSEMSTEELFPEMEDDYENRETDL